MASTVSEMTVQVIASHPYETLSTSIGILTILLLLTLLVMQQVWHAKAGGLVRRIRTIYSITVPLLLSFAVVVIARLVSLFPNSPLSP